MKKLLVALFVLCAATQAQAQDKSLLDQARAEGKASFYANITAVEPIMKAFIADTGVKGGIHADLDDEVRRHGDHRVRGRQAAWPTWCRAPLPVLELLKEKGVLASYRSPAAAGYPDWTQQGRPIQLFGIEYVALIYNKERVKPADVPKRYEDLTLPKWKDKIVMANPANHPTTIAWLIGLKENVFKTEAEWRNFLKGLAANKPMFVASFGPTPAPIESGEKLIGISMPKYIVTKAPAPLDWARLSQPMMGTPRAIAVTSKAPHPAAARAFVDYWLSKKSMEILAKDVGEYVLAPGIFPPIDGINKAKVIAIRELSDEETQKWGAEFKMIFDVK